jgi:hypothetical protein
MDRWKKNRYITINLREIGCCGVTGIQLFQNSFQWQALAYTDIKVGSFSKALCSKEKVPPHRDPTLIETKAVFAFDISGTVY